MILFLKGCWDWCVKHWKLTLAFIGGFIAFMIGYTRANRNTQRVKLDLEIKEKDIELLEENQDAFHKETVRNILYYEEKKAALEEKRNKALQDIENKKAKTKKELLESNEKIANILENKWEIKNEDN